MLEEIFLADKDSFSLEIISKKSIEIEESLYKLGQEFCNEKYRVLKVNLPRNCELRKKVLYSEINADDLVRMESRDLIPEGLRLELQRSLSEISDSKRSDFMEENRAAFLKNAGINKSEGGMFKCGKCLSTNTTYYEKQTRSAGEFFSFFILLSISRFKADTIIE